VHYLAQVHRSLGVDAPRAVVALGGKFAILYAAKSGTSVNI
jgi:hypothetical protein